MSGPAEASPMISTRFTELFDCTVPLQQAGMGGLATPELATAVARAGALGMVGSAMASAAELEHQLGRLPADLRDRVGVNFIVPFLDRDCVAVAAEQVRLVEFFFDIPDPELVALAHGGGALACWQVGSAEEARMAEDAGCDLVVAQGAEAGGHVRGELPLQALLDDVVSVVAVPVVAAGGIGTGRMMAAQLVAGAEAVRVGTRFVAAVEADAHPQYQAALARAGAGDTVLTEVFSGGWAAPHRVLRSAVETVHGLEEEVVGETTLGGATLPLTRFSALFPMRSTRGRIDAMALYAGTSVGAVGARVPAAEIVAELALGAEDVLHERCRRLLGTG